MKRKTFYYSDQLNDDFAGTNIKRKPLKKDYKFISDNVVFGFVSFILYYFLAVPLVFIFTKVVFREKIVGKDKLKPYGKSGYYLFGNHTHALCDAFTPALITFPKKAYILVNPDAVSIPIVSFFVKAFGGVPVADKPQLMPRYLKSVKTLSAKNKVVTVYPEEHIWPYYTGIRNFKDTSFKYPVITDKPTFVFTRTYKKRKILSLPRTIVYVDGPFLPDKNLSQKQNQKMLRDFAYDTMLYRSKQSDVQINDYVYRPNNDAL